MKKIFNFGLALAVVAAMALVGCSGGASLDLDTGVKGDSSIEGGKFAAGSFTGKGVPTDTIKAADSLDTDGEAKIVAFADGDAFKLFSGYAESKDEGEYWLDGPRSLVRPSVDYYKVSYAYYDVTLGGASTKYTGSGFAYDDYPTEDKLNWKKYTYYTGKDEYTKITKDDLNGWDKDSTYADFVMAVDGKYYSVSADGSDMSDAEKKYWAKKITTTDDSITIDNGWTSGDKKDEDDWVGTYTVKIVLKDGGDVEYSVEYKAEVKKIDDKGKAYYEVTDWYTVADEDGNPVKGEWSNNNGLISVTTENAIRTDKVSGASGTSILGGSVNLFYWNGSRLSDVTYIGAYWDGEIPSAAKSGKEDKDTIWDL